MDESLEQMETDRSTTLGFIHTWIDWKMKKYGSNNVSNEEENFRKNILNKYPFIHARCHHVVTFFTKSSPWPR